MDNVILENETNAINHITGNEKNTNTTNIIV
jgi:hypothetical protein